MNKDFHFATNLILSRSYNLELERRNGSLALICSEKRRKVLKSSLFCLFFVCFVCLFFFVLLYFYSLLLLHVKSSSQDRVGLFCVY